MAFMKADLYTTTIEFGVEQQMVTITMKWDDAVEFGNGAASSKIVGDLNNALRWARISHRIHPIHKNAA